MNRDYVDYKELEYAGILVRQVYMRLSLPRDVEAICRAITSTYEHVFPFSLIHFDCPYLLHISFFPTVFTQSSHLQLGADEFSVGRGTERLGPLDRS